MTSSQGLSTLPDMTAQPKVVVLGGGTGSYMVLQALRSLPVELTAILTMVDDGGSNRVVRDQFGLLPTSGICQAISALSDEEPILRELFNYRFHKGQNFSGMRFGNLFLAAVTDIVGNQREAIEETSRLLKVKGRILPISYDDVRLVARYEDGREIVGEHLIDEPTHHEALKIVDLSTRPAATLSPDAAEALDQADYIIMGPGDFYTNTVANFVVKGVPEALKKSKAKKIFFSNLMTKQSETPGFTLQTFLEEIDRYYGLSGLDLTIVNSNSQYPKEILDLYAQDQSVPVADNLGETYKGITILRADLLSSQIHTPNAGDTLVRSMLRHDPDKVREFFAEYFLRKDLSA